MAARFDNILQTIGHTPVVKIAKLAPPGVEVFAKLEAFNPLGSVKDRLALGVIEAAERAVSCVRGRPSSRPAAATPESVWRWCARKKAIRS